jgi:hypothetical protein
MKTLNYLALVASVLAGVLASGEVAHARGFPVGKHPWVVHRVLSPSQAIALCVSHAPAWFEVRVRGSLVERLINGGISGAGYRTLALLDTAHSSGTVDTRPNTPWPPPHGIVISGIPLTKPLPFGLWVIASGELGCDGRSARRSGLLVTALRRAGTG